MIFGRPDYDGGIIVPDELIPSNEPGLLVRGQDSNAYALALVYIGLAEADGVHPDLLLSMRFQAERLRDWPVKKVPDVGRTEAQQKHLDYEARRREYNEAHGLPLGLKGGHTRTI